MQLSGVRRRQAASPAGPIFTNHTPKDFEMMPFSLSQSPVMFASAGMAVASGPLYTNTIMGQSTSAFQRSHDEGSKLYRNDGHQKYGVAGTCSPANSIVIRREGSVDSYSLNHTDTTQAPYATANNDDMMTSTSTVRVPVDSRIRELADFLRYTGPPAPHRRPSKLEHPKRGINAPRKALRFLKRGNKRARDLAAQANQVLYDEGGLLEGPRAACVDQRLTSTGKRYLALNVKASDEEPYAEAADDKENVVPSPSKHNVGDSLQTTSDAGDLDLKVVDSRVSISFPEEHITSEMYDDYCLALNDRSSPPIIPISQPRESSAHLPIEVGSTVRFVNNFSSPIRPRAKTPSPPTPVPGSAVSMADSYRSDLMEHPAARPFETGAALSSHPVRQEETLTALPQISLPREEFPVKHPAPGREVEIKHPLPRRLASHPVLLQRASSIASSLYPRSFSDSPGPPPPRSPLRLRRDPRTIESIIATHNITYVRENTPKLAPTIEAVTGYYEALEAMKPCIVTDCTGPIKRPRSRGEKSSMMIQRAHPISRKEREERIKSRKLRDKPTLERAIDTIVHTSSQAPAKRLRKARPQINIPDLHVAPLVTRPSSSASSNASWKKISECTRSPVSPVPSQDTPTSNGEKTGYTPISPTASHESAMTALTRMALSPVMLVAEQVPLPKSKATPKPARLIVKDSKSYAPRPRSASIPRNALKRRSRASGPPSGVQTPVTQISRPNSPSQAGKDDTPPLPSPPPNRALPPTPPASGSERPARMYKKDLPTLPAYEILSKDSTPPKKTEHVATQAQRKSISSKESSNSKTSNGKDTSKFDARLAALEKQNAMLSAALMAVLRTNGALNNPLSAIAPVTEEPESPKQMQWETRIARRSAASQQHSSPSSASAGASHAASSSESSALEMYIATRRGSRHGCGGG